MTHDLDSVKKILVLRYRSIGDILLANPSLAGLRHRFPDATIDLLVDDVFAELLYKNRNVDHVLLNERKPLKKGLRAEWGRLMEIRSGNYDLVVDLQAGPRGAWAALFSGAKVRVGHLFRFRNRICYNLYGEAPEPDEHSWRVQFKTVRPLGIDWPGEPDFFLQTSEDSAVSAQRKLEDRGLMFDRPLVVLHPGARVQVKRWPAAKMGALARWLVDEKNAAVILAGSGADEEEIKLIRRVSGYALPYFTDFTIGELTAVLATADLLVCNDSGPMHMAGVLDTPTVAMFGPSDPSLWAPMGSNKVIVTAEPMECMPCDQKKCPYVGDHCMTRIEVDEVKRAVDKLGVF